MVRQPRGRKWRLGPGLLLLGVAALAGQPAPEPEPETVPEPVEAAAPELVEPGPGGRLVRVGDVPEAQAPFAGEMPAGVEPSAAGVAARARWAAGRDAQQRGLAGFAAGLFREALELGGLTAEEEAAVSLGLATAWIAQGKPALARPLLERQADADAPALRLRRAAVAWQEGKPAQSVELLEGVEVRDLAEEDQPWWYLLRGLLAEWAGDVATAEVHLARARELAAEPGLAAELELLLLRGRLQTGGATDAAIDELVARTRTNAGTALGFRAARLAAPAMAQAGRLAEALALLEEQLRYPAVEEGGNGDQIRLLYAQLAGPDSPAGRQRLREVLRRPAEALRQRAALAQLAAPAEHSAEAAAELRALLNELIARDPPPPLLDAFLLQRARLSLAENRFDEADEDAARLLDRVPGSDLTREAERLRAFIAVVRVPPRWRVAATLLGRLRDREPPGPERNRLGRLTADCFFIDGDYRSAASAYAAVLREPDLPAAERAVLVYQQVLAELRAGRLVEAESVLADEPAPLGDDLWRWRAEWNLLSAWRVAGRATEALARLELLLTEPAAERLGGPLRLRLRWLELELAVELGRANVGDKVDALLVALEGPEGEELAVGAREQLAAHALFLRARARLEAGDPARARAVLDQLRQRYPRSEPAVLSHLLEARYHVLASRLDDAQRSLTALRETYPDSPHAPRALYETALILEQRGLAATWQEAISLLEELVNRYPGDALVYAARLKQADLTRRLGDFGAAQLIYEGLINRWPDHPERWRAELGRADAFVAQAATNPDRLSDAVAIYERLVDLPNVPVDVRIEAGGKWGSALVRLGRPEAAGNVYGLVVSRFLTDAAAPARGPVGTYWLARILLEQGELAERAGRYAEARRLYHTLTEYHLPGTAAAEARLQRLDTP